MGNASQLDPGTVVSWQGADYVVQRTAILRATDFSWRLSQLAPALGGEIAWIAWRAGDLYSVDEVLGLDGSQPMPLDSELVMAPRPAQALELGDQQFALARYSEAMIEMAERGRPTVFDKGRLLEYTGDETRLVVFASPRRQMAFVARPAAVGQLQIYGRADD